MAQITREAPTTQDAPTILPAPRARRFPIRLSWSWLPVLPFFLYVAIFLLLPTVWLAVGAFQDSAGNYTSDNVSTVLRPENRDAYWQSIKLSVTTALTGGIFGLFIAYAAVKEGSPGWIRSALITFSGVAANFAGVPLAFAFVATLGTTGVLTLFLSDHGINLYAHGFTLASFTGLTLAYTYFQLPLMILVISPALDGLRRQWREAATNLGASTFQFWRLVGLPILWPSLLGAMVLLFGSAFSAYATPYALVGGQINLVPIVIGSVLSGNVVANPQFGDALALGMIVVIGVSLVIYALLQRRSSKWLR
jgi:putative spermidine/putrescine transport system permease protein